MTNILCNSQFFHQRFGGVTRYSSCLIEKMINDNINFKICSPIFKNNFLKTINKKYIYGLYFSKYPNIFFLRLLNNFFSNFFLKGKKENLIHFMYDPEYLYKLNSNKKIITIHDTIHEKFNLVYKDNFINKRKKILETMDKIICVSENTKKDLLNFYNLTPDKIEVIYNGSDHLIPIKNIQNLKISIEKPYILYVGSRSKYKNFNLFIEAFSKSKKIYDNFDVICFGGGNFSNLEINLLKKFKVLNKIKLVHGDDKKLKSCYQNASLFIYPSLYEGFGISVLEAMHEGCPTVVSDIPVFREILDNKSYFFDPKNFENLIFNMETILFDSEIKNNLISYGRTDSKKYTWAKCYNKTIGLYNLFK
tara:strand:- start:769 stop:1857 length:1089 start_codon:yes stop_codon:yes gene_type:complete